MSNSVEMATKCNSGKATGKNCQQTWPLFHTLSLVITERNSAEGTQRGLGFSHLP